LTAALNCDRIDESNMNNLLCSNCPSEEFINEGNCSRHKPDGYVVRCGPQWTITKHKYFEVYCKILTHAMGNKFKNLIFIDLYAGPGLYSNRKSGAIEKGSPLIALENHFKEYHFVDMNIENIDALKYRIGKSNNCHFYNYDANEAVKEINNKLPINSLAFCLADPDNMAQLKFSSLEILFRNRRIDFLINYPYWMYFKRVAKHMIDNDSPENPVDEFMGSPDWKISFNNNNRRFDNHLFQNILNSYSNQFYSRGYSSPGTDNNNYVVINNSKKAPIYLLLFFSRNQLGYKFWHEGMESVEKYIDPSLKVKK
jgi:three-Cys-motif partner protein